MAVIQLAQLKNKTSDELLVMQKYSQDQLTRYKQALRTPTPERPNKRPCEQADDDASLGFLCLAKQASGSPSGMTLKGTGSATSAYATCAMIANCRSRGLPSVA
jgi:hypothetical protein